MQVVKDGLRDRSILLGVTDAMREIRWVAQNRRAVSRQVEADLAKLNHHAELDQRRRLAHVAVHK